MQSDPSHALSPVSPVAASGRTFQNPGIDIDTVKIQTVSIPQGSLPLPFYSHTHFLPAPTPLAISNTFSIFVIFHLENVKINGVIQHVTFGDWLLGFAFGIVVCIYHTLFNHSPVEGHLGCFQISAIANKAAVSIHVWVFV